MIVDLYVYVMLSVISVHCNIFVKPSVFYIYTRKTVRKVSVSYLYSPTPTMGDYSKATKRKVAHFKYWKKKHVCKPRVTLPLQQKTFGDSITSCQNLRKFFEQSRK